MEGLGGYRYFGGACRGIHIPRLEPFTIAEPLNATLLAIFRVFEYRNNYNKMIMNSVIL
jgi:hypothetical protein